MAVTISPVKLVLLVHFEKIFYFQILRERSDDGSKSLLSS